MIDNPSRAMGQLNTPKTGLLRLFITIALLAVAASFWFLQIYGSARPQVAPLDASPRAFSAARAEHVLAQLLEPEIPHPVSSDENANVRARIVQELSVLRVPAFVLRSFACHAMHSYGVLTCATVNDILAVVKPGQGRAIVLLAHYDSVPAGPGAADDESGVATVIETIRALLTRGLKSRHPILAVLTDGEEAGLLGAAAFLHEPALKARVGAVVNVEARGNQGPSLLFQTSPGDGPLIDLYANNVPDYATSSVYAEIYRFLPNDTDLTLFIRDGFPSFNFAFAGNIADYHTALDRRVNLDPVSLQEQGDNMLGVASGLEQADFAKLRGSDDIYLDILGRVLPRVPAAWDLPLSLAAFVLLLAATLLARREPISWRRWLCAFAITPALVLVAAGSGFALQAIAAFVAGTPDPSYAHPAALRIALAFGLAGATLLVSRLTLPGYAPTAVWLWIAALGIVVAIFLPGLSPYFLIPASAAAILLLATACIPGGWDSAAGAIAVFAAALVALLVWSSISASGESVMGLKLHPLFTVPFAIGLTTLVPLFMRYAMPRRLWATATTTLFVAALCGAVVQGLEPAYSSTAAQRLNVTYVEDRHRALWAVDTLAPVPGEMREIVSFASEPQRLSRAMPLAYVAPAGAPRFPLPTATIASDRYVGAGRSLTLVLHGSRKAAQMILVIPRSAMLKAIDLSGRHFDAPPSWANEDSVALACMSRDCASTTVTLTLASRSTQALELYEHRFGLPDFAKHLVAARPPTAVQSQNGDGVVLMNKILVPALR
ncbi:MAG TPA: M20/M25/M40 family metallo-hydrolase [Rhizomicrobium sp.]|jgi:hypothetical protein|nr:M20/M25/M40 family metallo-hydrolase [Rhizomicrobium sp.]